MNKQTRNKAYPQEFREQVVKLVQAGGQTVSEIAREFEISTDSVRRWLKQAERDAGSRQDGLSTPERKELAQAGLRSSWETIRRQLAGWVRLTTSLRAADGRWIQCRQDSRPDAKAAELARAIGLMPGLHRMRTSHAADATPSPSSTQ